LSLLVYAKAGVGIKRYSAGPTPLGYERSWKHEFKVTEFKVEDVPVGAAAPEECRDHYPNCFIAHVNPMRPKCEGIFKMITPIDIQSEMPGRDRELLSLSAASMLTDVSWWVGHNSTISIWVDGAKRFDTGPMPFTQDSWNNKTWSFSIKLGDAKKLDLWVYLAAWISPYGTVRRHVAGHDGNPILLTGRYFTDEPPPLADVLIRVLDRTNMRPVAGAYVALKVGDIVKADGYTDGEGKVSFSNIEEGGYTLCVFKSGYHDLTTGIDVKPPKVEKTVLLTPIPSPPFPWEWVAIGIGVVVIGGVAIAALRRAMR
jgi:hypothetical protein